MLCVTEGGLCVHVLAIGLCVCMSCVVLCL